MQDATQQKFCVTELRNKTEQRKRKKKTIEQAWEIIWDYSESVLTDNKSKRPSRGILIEWLIDWVIDIKKETQKSEDTH